MNILRLLLLSCILAPSGQYLYGRNHQVTVFIHGTSQAGLGLLNFRRVWHDLFDGTSWYEKALTKSRNDQFLEKSDLMLGMGMVDVTHLIQLPATDPAVRHKAAIHCIRAYDAISKAVAPTHDEQHYYTFGWLGIMSERGREAAAEQLYDALYKIRKDYTDQGDTVTFTLHAHSHGGQLVLHLAQLRTERRDNDFVIDQALLSAAPIYYHKARHVNSGMFKTIINFYSEGDMIQVGDHFSTPAHGCGRTLLDSGVPLLSGNTPSPYIIDARLSAYDRHDTFGHASFFILDRYMVLNYLPRSKRKAIRALLKQIHPLPLVTLYPALVPAMLKQLQESEKSGYQQIDCNFVLNDQGTVTCELNNGSVITMAHVPHTALASASRSVREAYADTSYRNEASKAMHSIKHIFGPRSKPKQPRA